MLRRRLLLVMVCLLGVGAKSQAAPRPPVARIIVQERGATSFGSGTLIDCRDQYGLVVTNWHVVRDATGKIEVVFPDGFRSEARSVKLDEDWDLAALVIWRPRVAPAKLAMRPPQPGDALTICGYGSGEYREATGRCTEFYAPEVGMPHELVELSVEARQGDSGGPILNDQGQVAGVLFGAGQGTTLGSFGPRVESFLATLAPNIGQRDSAPQLPRTPALVAQVPPTESPPQAIAGWQTVPQPQALASETAQAAEQQAALEPVAHGFTPWQSVVQESPELEPQEMEQSPLVASIHAEAPVDAPGEMPEWFETGRNVLAMMGAAFVVLHLVKAAA